MRLYPLSSVYVAGVLLLATLVELVQFGLGR